MRLLAISDIHGCLTALDTLLGMVRPQDEDFLVMLGDYVDRGPDSRGVLERLLELRNRHRLVALCGNHEQMMLEARHNEDVRLSWLMYGGDRTLRSYATETTAGQLSDVPAEHWQFLESCIDWFETESHFFVHGNVAPDVPLEEQPISLLRWEIFNDPPPHMSGKVMVCGHTRQPSGLPRNIGHAICIDTWVYGAGWLTCLDVLSGHVWQANQRGECREAEIGDYFDPVVCRDE